MTFLDTGLAVVIGVPVGLLASYLAHRFGRWFR